jgi:Glycosyl hydrolases family 28
MSSAPFHWLARGGAAAAVIVGLGCTSAAPRVPDGDVGPDETPPSLDASAPHDQKSAPPAAPDATVTQTPDSEGTVEPPPTPVPAGMFSNPAAVKVPSFPERTCPVSAGASAAVINAAIDGCSAMGGGTVTFAPGTYSVGSIHLKSNVRLALNGATLRGAGTDAAEPYTTPIACQDEGHRHWHNAMIWGEDVTNVAIVGPGKLDGGGLDSNNQKMIALKSSSVMLFENFEQSGTGHFGYLLTDCHHITMSKLTMHPSRDGVDLMQCTDVNAHDLTITGGPDDAFALKSDCTIGKALPTSNITVRDSTLGSGCTALQIGSETWGNFENISWSNIKVVNGGKSGIGIQMNDGAVIKNMSYDNITLSGTSFPIFLSVTSLLRAPAKMPGHAENIRFSNITATNLVAGNNHSPQNATIVISGEAGIPHKGIVLEHIKVTFPGGGSPSADPPEGADLKGGVEYNPRYITPMPAYGVFSRHVTGLELHDVQLMFGGSEARVAVIARDVDGLTLDGLGAQKGSGPSLELDGVKSLVIKSSAPLMDTTMSTVGKLTL